MYVLLFALWVMSLDCGCTQSKQTSNYVEPQTTYVEPISPIHKSVVRTRQTSASFVESDDHIVLRQAIFQIKQLNRPAQDEKKAEAPMKEHRRIKRKKSEHIVFDLD